MKTNAERYKELCGILGKEVVELKLKQWLDRLLAKTGGRAAKAETGNFDVLVKEIVEDLNRVAGLNYRVGNKATRGLIHNLYNQIPDLTKDDFFKVHRAMHAKWAGTEWARYLRPSTLYRVSHFEGYLQEYKPLEEKVQARREAQRIRRWWEFDSFMAFCRYTNRSEYRDHDFGLPEELQEYYKMGEFLLKARHLENTAEHIYDEQKARQAEVNNEPATT